MRGVLGLGLTVGVLTALWSLASGGSLLLALLAYSAAGTSTTLLAAIFVATAPERNEVPLFIDRV